MIKYRTYGKKKDFSIIWRLVRHTKFIQKLHNYKNNNIIIQFNAGGTVVVPIKLFHFSNLIQREWIPADGTSIFFIIIYLSNISY